MLGGMLVPGVLATLIGQKLHQQNIHQKWHCVPIAYAVYCAAAMVALMFILDTRDVNLADLDQADLYQKEARNTLGATSGASFPP
jgi:hypothetical protein